MKIFLLLFTSIVLLYSKNFYIMTYTDMITATNISLMNKEDDTWFFVDKHNKLIEPSNPISQNNFYDYNQHIINQNKRIKIYTIPSKAMNNTIKKGQYILTLIDNNKIPMRNDLITFKDPTSQKDIHYLKRCIAIGGDIIFAKNKDIYLHPYEGNQFIKTHYKNYEIISLDNKLFIKNPYKQKNKGIHFDANITKENSNHFKLMKRIQFDMIEIPKNEFFMIGDNRDHSNDSRFFGTIKQKDILGYSILLKFKDNPK